MELIKAAVIYLNYFNGKLLEEFLVILVVKETGGRIIVSRTTQKYKVYVVSASYKNTTSKTQRQSFIEEIISRFIIGELKETETNLQLKRIVV